MKGRLLHVEIRIASGRAHLLEYISIISNNTRKKTLNAQVSLNAIFTNEGT